MVAIFVIQVWTRARQVWSGGIQVWTPAEKTGTLQVVIHIGDGGGHVVDPPGVDASKTWEYLTDPRILQFYSA